MQVKVYDTKYVTVCTSSLPSVCHSLTLTSDWLRGRFTERVTAGDVHLKKRLRVIFPSLMCHLSIVT